MDVVTQVDELEPLLKGLAKGISPDQLDNATPCTEFSVRNILEHMVGGAKSLAGAFRGEPPASPESADLLGDFDGAVSGLFAAVRSPGALERIVQSPFGEVPGAVFARFVVLDGLVHGWDIAVATGQPYEPADDLVAAVQSYAEEVLEPMRSAGAFAAATEPPVGATPIERLAAFTGREV